MAVRSVLVPRPPEAVWSVLSDPRAYGRWVVGTHDSEPLTRDWPAEGSALRYAVRAGVRRVTGRTVVRRCEPGRQLELEAQMPRPGVGRLRISIDIRPWGDETLVIVDEHPLAGAAGRLHNPLSELALQIRHRHMLQRLTRVVEEAEHAGETA
ncbi:SRPBCC family protein [Streptomyces sp. 6N223]|uniref:SRPBCC family protein n=1 Tax=Streptomyces sp. 6N223 TaxID=3457412 RepID=UPI003FD5AD22